jgi:26S proteasome regulatory subunit N2
LGELDDSLTFALGAGQAFDLADSSEYVTTIICKLTIVLFYSLLLM